jgi:hypothetical protein
MFARLAHAFQGAEVGVRLIGKADDRREAGRVAARFIVAGREFRLRAGQCVPDDVVEKVGHCCPFTR